MGRGMYLNDNSGFTLLEILIAIFIFAIVITAVFGANITTNRVIDSTDSQAEINMKARIAMERITDDLAGIYNGEGGILQGRKLEVAKKGGDLLRFVSTAHVAFTKDEPPVGLAVIKYSVFEDPKTKLLKLYRLDIPYRPGYLEQEYSEQKGYLLADGLSAVRLRYFDQNGNEEDDWLSKRDSEQATEENDMPVMIVVTLRFGMEKRNTLYFKTAVALPFGKKKHNGQDGG